MMNNNKKIIAIISVLVVAILGLVAYYLYEVVALHVDYKEHLFRMLAIICVLISTIIRLSHGLGNRLTLKSMEKAYQKEIGVAFSTKPDLRKKLLSGCRLYNENKILKALEIFSKLKNEAENKEDKFPVFLFMALCYEDAGEPEEAVRLYNDILEFDPENEQVHGNLGVLYSAMGNNEKALEHYNTVIEIAPDDYILYMNRANCYFRMADYEKSIKDAQYALELKNNGMEAATLLAVIYALLGDEENKRKYYHIAITSGRNPDDLDEVIDFYLHEV